VNAVHKELVERIRSEVTDLELVVSRAQKSSSEAQQTELCAGKLAS
jgi:hypothetical protein